MIDVLLTDYLQRALVAALFTGLAAPAIGVYLVQRRLSLMGDGIGHVAVTGVALGLLTGASPTWTAVVVCVLGAVVIEVIRERGTASGDVALALLFYGGIAGGVLLSGIAGQNAAGLQGYLFGSLLSVSDADVLTAIVLAVLVVVVAIGLGPQLFAIAHDQDFARVAGLNVRFYNVLIAVLAALSVTVAMRTVGLLLVSAMMVVPVATAQQVSRSFKGTLTLALVLGVASSVGGLLVSTWASVELEVNAQPGASIVVLALAGFLLAWPVGILLRRRTRLREPFPALPPLGHEHTDDHPHTHGEDCGHLAVPHGDHVDYVHDGHRHAPHGEHYDEH